MGTKIPPKSTHLRNLFPALKPFCQSRSLLSNYFKVPERRQMVGYHQNVKSLTADCCLEMLNGMQLLTYAGSATSTRLTSRKGCDGNNKPANAPHVHTWCLTGAMKPENLLSNIKEKQDENRGPSNVICVSSQLKTSRDVLV
ncbi:unnamed protein product, partial [Musa textilis]